MNSSKKITENTLPVKCSCNKYRRVENLLRFLTDTQCETHKSHGRCRSLASVISDFCKSVSGNWCHCCRLWISVLRWRYKLQILRVSSHKSHGIRSSGLEVILNDTGYFLLWRRHFCNACSSSGLEENHVCCGVLEKNTVRLATYLHTCRLCEMTEYCISVYLILNYPI